MVALVCSIPTLYSCTYLLMYIGGKTGDTNHSATMITGHRFIPKSKYGEKVILSMVMKFQLMHNHPF